MDNRYDLAVYTLTGIVVEDYVRRSGFVSLRVGIVTVIACYLSPNTSFSVYSNKVFQIADHASRQSEDIIIAGDLNAKSSAWGSARTDRKGNIWEEVFHALQISPINTGSQPTFVRGACGTIIDVTAVSDTLVDKVVDWSVLGEETLSDHMYISFSINCRISKNRP